MEHALEGRASWAPLVAAEGPSDYGMGITGCYSERGIKDEASKQACVSRPVGSIWLGKRRWALVRSRTARSKTSLKNLAMSGCSDSFGVPEFVASGTAGPAGSGSAEPVRAAIKPGAGGFGHFVVAARSITSLNKSAESV